MASETDPRQMMPRSNRLVALAQSRGIFARRVRGLQAVADGVRITVEMVLFGDHSDGRRPVIVSDEPFAAQMIDTHLPNRPPELGIPLDEDATQPEMLLEVRVLAPGIVRVRLGRADAIDRERDFGMLAPDALAALPPTGDELLMETSAGNDGWQTMLTAGDVTIQVQHDPFAISMSFAGAPEATLATALDDRDVHGLLCTPPPGVRASAEEGGDPEAFWSWALTPDERLYGLGERFTGLDQRGERLTLWNTDAWGTTSASSYKYVPYLQSSRGYGLFFHTPAAVSVALGNPSVRAAQVCVAEDELDLFVLFGPTPAELLERYTLLTGRAHVPPRWAFGVWLSRCRYESRAEVEAVAERARDEDVPCDVLHIDPAWLGLPGLSCDFIASDERFPDLAGMVRELHERGFKVSLWELPYVSEASPRYTEAVDAGYFLRDEAGTVVNADFGVPPGDGYTRAIVDFTNPGARAWWQELHRPWLRAGVEIFKTDYGEAVPAAARAANGMSGRTLHNLYPLLYNAAVDEVIAQERGRPGLVWARSGWAGSQRYPAQWGGDPKTDAWSMRASLRGGLNLALSAPGIWAHDIGGFYGPPPSPALYVRWAQFGLLSPLARAHGTTPREPWEFGEQALAIFRRYAKLRMRLNPYLHTVAWQAQTRGLPMLRPFLLEFPDDAVSHTIDDAYLLGPDLLVAPVFSDEQGVVQRQLYLPPGEWIDYWADERVAGGRYVTRQVPLDVLPLYVRAGAVLPLGHEVAFLGDDPPEEVTLEVYPGAERDSQIVWDDAGSATSLRLRGGSADWQLTIDGQRGLTWQVRWHVGPGDVREQRVRGTGATLALPDGPR